MDKARLEELKHGVSNMAFIALSRLTDKDARANIIRDGNDIQALIDDEISRSEATTDAEVQAAIERLQTLRSASNLHVSYIEPIKLAIRALQQYKPVEPCEVCSNIGYFEFSQIVTHEELDIKFCPNCGRRLDGEQDAG